ncbi:RNA polymerase sigma factor [Arthrobacter sp. A5]|uniref:RNA polymerase sigma factor n=1 Tax=Arthrobacter sp. A5 TaxID=576926 RepID=UPI003DAA1E33
MDDTLDLLFLCCHPALNSLAQVALTLRAVGGLTTAEIARAFLVPDATMAQRISRAKQRIRANGSRFVIPSGTRSERIPVVLHVVYLIFTEGHTASSGNQVYRIDLTSEAIRLARQLRSLLPEDGEVTGLLALMLLTDARQGGRSPDGSALVPLAEQDRSLWDAAAIAEGVALISASLSNKALGPYQIQAAIAAVHDEAAHADDTDWAEIVELYDLLMVLSPGPTVALNRIVALAMTSGPAAGLRTLNCVETQYGLSELHRVDAVRAHLFEMVGDVQAAQEHYRNAAQRTSNVPEQRYLNAKARTLAASLTRKPPLSGEAQSDAKP